MTVGFRVHIDDGLISEPLDAAESLTSYET